MVEFRGVSKIYAQPGGGRVEALVDASFRVGSAEMAVVSGPSGSGKSTLLRLLWGEERASRGTVLVGGTDAGSLNRGGLARLRQGLGIVPQDRRLLADRTVFGNVAFVLRALGVPRREVRERALSALRAAGLAARLPALPAELAAGERQRLVLARALAGEPRLLLADEPTAMLDDGTAEAVLALLRAAHARGTAVLITTHARDLAPRLGARAFSLADGRLGLGAGAG